jgi:DNA-binding CsgD family transcriptional regulator
MTLVSTEGFDRIVNAIYRAGLDPAAWDEFVSTLCAHTSQHIYWGFHGYDRVTEQALVVIGENFSPEAVTAYFNHYGEQNPWIPEAMRLPSGTVCDGRDLVAEEDLFRTEFYNDWLVPNENISIGSGAIIHNDATRAALLAGNIRRKDEDRFHGSVTTLIARLAPHLERAIELNRAINIERASPRVDNPNASFVLAADASPIACSPSGTDMMDQRAVLSLDPRGRLRFYDRRAQSIFAKALDAIEVGQLDALPTGFRAETAEGAVLTCIISPAGGSAPASSVAQTIFSAVAPAAVLVIVDPSAHPHLCRQALCTAFGLTQAEAELAEMITTGASLAEIAELRQVSKHTVKNQLKSLFHKTGTSRQGALIALLARFLPG